jgi:two-component system response regulator AtoC
MSFIELENLNFADEKTNRVKNLLPAVRTSRANVLISGPAGIGKSHLAKHLLAAYDYISLDVNELMEEFDFGAFFTKCEVHAFLLENVEKLSASQQRNLFENLEARAESDKIRILSTCRTPLKSLVQKSQFREDLYYRLTVLTLELPALGDRIADIETVAKYLVRVFGIIHQKAELDLTPEAVEKLKMWNWPGNVRELENVLERAVVIAKEDFVEASAIAIENQEAKKDAVSFSGMTLSEVEQKLILQTLQMTAQNRTRAAEILGISIRTLRNKINEYRQAGLV